MNRQTRTNLILLTMVLLLGAAVLAELKREEWERPAPLSRIDRHAVREVRIECTAPCAPRRFEKVQGHWWMRAPYALAADDEAVSRLLSIAALPVRRRHAATELEPARLGLAPPQVVLMLDAARIEFGGTDALNGDRYVRFGDTVSLVPDRFSAWLYAAPESELDRHLLPPGRQAVTLALRDRTVALEAAAWASTEARALRRIDPTAPMNDRGLPLTLTLDDGSALRFVVHQVDSTYAFRREDLALEYLFDVRAARPLLAEPPP